MFTLYIMICNQAYDDLEIVQRIDCHYDLFRRIVRELKSTSVRCFQPMIIGVIYTSTSIMRLWNIWNS
jgi:hypothetical protein